MDQILVDIYSFANICLLIWYIKSYKLELSPGLLVLGFYVLVAVMAIPAYDLLKKDSFFSQYNFSNITLFPYIFLFITTLLFIKPTFKFEGYLKNMRVSISERKMRFFIIFYTICALISIYCFYRTITSNVTIDALSEVRQNIYEGETIEVYNNVIEHVIVLFTVQFNTVASIVFFYALATMRKKIGVLWLIGLGLGVVAPPFMDAIKTASRGMIVKEAFLMLLCYSYFSRLLSRRIKSFFVIIGTAVLIIFFVYSMIVTELRFGEGEDAYSSIFAYFGQPTIVFNSQTAGISDFAYGVRFFKPIVEAIGIDPGKILGPIVKSWSPCFDTFIGDLYVDFGPIGTFMLALIIPYLINMFFRRKKSLSFAHLYLMTFYCVNLQGGSLVTKNGFCIELIFCFVVYHLCNVILGHSFNNSSLNFE